MVTEVECKSKASGALQHKIWKPGELNMARTKQLDEMKDQLHNFFWDPCILKIEGYE